MQKIIISIIVTVGLIISASIIADKGRYQLFKINEGGREIAYKIDTATGHVWDYSARFIEKSEDIGLTGKEKEDLDKLIEQAKKQGKDVWTRRYWALTYEEIPKGYSIY